MKTLPLLIKQFIVIAIILVLLLAGLILVFAEQTEGFTLGVFIFSKVLGIISLLVAYACYRALV